MNRSYQNALRILVLAALATCGTLVSSTSTTAAASTTLKTVWNSDKTASVGLPDGWKIVKGGNGYIGVAGPNHDFLNLGAIIVAKNAPAGTGVSGEIRFALPFSASLKDKFTTIIQRGAAQQGEPVPQVTFASQAPTKLPMCSRLIGGTTATGQSRKFVAIMCSLQPDYLGYYKNIIFLANIPATRVTQDRALIAQIVQSYRMTPAMFKAMISSYTTLPPRPSAVQMGAISAMAPYEDPTNSDCFDYNVIRESPPWEVPMHCGGTMPE